MEELEEPCFAVPAIRIYQSETAFLNSPSRNFAGFYPEWPDQKL